MRADLNILLDIIRDKAGYDFVGFRCRKRAVADLKFRFAYVARHRLAATFADIAGVMGWRDHSTAIHAARQTEDFITIYPEWRRSIAEIEDELEFRMAVGLPAYQTD